MRLQLLLALGLGCLSLTSAIMIERGIESLEDDDEEDDGWIFDEDLGFNNDDSNAADLNDEGDDDDDSLMKDFLFVNGRTDEEKSDESISEDSTSGESDVSEDSVKDWQEEDEDGLGKTGVDSVEKSMANMSQAMSALLNRTYHRMLDLPSPSSARNQRTQLVVDFLDDLKDTFADNEHIQPSLQLRTRGHRHRGHGHRPHGHWHKHHGHGHRPHGHGHRPHGHWHKPHGHGHKPHGHGHKPHGHGHKPHGHGHKPHGHGHKPHGHGHGPQVSPGRFDMSRFNEQKSKIQMTRNKRSALWSGLRNMFQGKSSPFQPKEAKGVQKGKLPGQNGFARVGKNKPLRKIRNFLKGQSFGKEGLGKGQTLPSFAKGKLAKVFKGKGSGKGFGHLFKGQRFGQGGSGKGDKQPSFGKGKFAQLFNGKHAGKAFQKEPYGHWKSGKFPQGRPERPANAQTSPMAALVVSLNTKADAITTLLNDSCSTLQSLPAADNNEHSKASLRRKMFVMSFLGKYMALLKNSTDSKEDSSEEEQGDEKWCVAKTEAMIRLINNTNQALRLMRSEWLKSPILIRAHFQGTNIAKGFMCEGYFRIVNVTEPVLKLVNQTYHKMLKMSEDEDGKTLLFLDFVMKLEDTLDFENLTRQLQRERYVRLMKRYQNQEPQGTRRHFWKNRGKNHGKGDVARPGGKFGPFFGKWNKGKKPGGKFGSMIGKWNKGKQAGGKFGALFGKWGKDKKPGGKFGAFFGRWNKGKNSAKSNPVYNKQGSWKSRFDGKPSPPKGQSRWFHGGKKPKQNQWRNGGDFKGGKDNKGSWMAKADKTKKKPTRQINWTNKNTKSPSGKPRWGPTMTD